MPKELIYGPQNKSIYTQEFELIAKALLSSPEKASFHLEGTSSGHKALILDFDSHHYNVSDIMHNADFHHIHMNNTDSHHYTSFLKGEALNQPTPLDDSFNFNYSLPTFDHNPKYANLTYGEKCAIQTYTGSFYGDINSFLHGDTHILDAYKAYPEAFQAVAKELILHTAMMASGLNQIDGTGDPQESYRGEHAVTEQNFQERHDVIQGEDAFTEEPAFMSTSSDPFIAGCFEGKACIHFVNNTAKSVQGLSYFPHESEYILLPGQVKWISESTSETKYGSHTNYVAESVRSLLDFSDPIHTDQELSQFKTLADSCAHNNIQVGDVLTDCNKSLLDGLHGLTEAPHSSVTPDSTPMDVEATNTYLPLMDFTLDTTTSQVLPDIMSHDAIDFGF